MEKEQIRKEFFKLRIKGHSYSQCRKILLAHFGYETTTRTLQRWNERAKKQQKEYRTSSRELQRKQKELESSRKIHEKLGKPRFSFDRDLKMKVEREMEKIKPEELAVIQGCLDGEVDYKRYYDYWLAKQNNEHPIPNYFYQWQRRLRDVASVLLIDASASTNRFYNEKNSILDRIKEAAFIVSAAADSLEDKISVLAYNGKGASNVRMFVLKDFNERLNVLEERLGLLQPELNNRDGAAIRYASQFLLSATSKSKFLFHLSDMQPSDLEFEVENPAVKTYRYSGENALNDVSHAYQISRSFGIVPCGICIKPVTSKPDLQLGARTERKKPIINQALLLKLRETRKHDNQLFDERLQQNFRRNYRIVEDLSLLPKLLKDLYLDASFS